MVEVAGIEPASVSPLLAGDYMLSLSIASAILCPDKQS